MLENTPIAPFSDSPPPWSETLFTYSNKLGSAMTSQWKHLQRIKVQHMNAWNKQWKGYQKQVIKPSIAQMAPLDKKQLKMHSLLKKAKSALATQIRTGKIGLANFFHKRCVPGITSPACPCDWHRQTLEHVIMFCRPTNDRRVMFCKAGTNSYQALTESPKLLKSLIAWLMKSGILTQFSLAVQLLYQQ